MDSEQPTGDAAAAPLEADWWLLRCPHCHGVLRVEGDRLLGEPGFVCGQCMKLIRTPPRPAEMLDFIDGSAELGEQRRRQRQRARADESEELAERLSKMETGQPDAENAAEVVVGQEVRGAAVNPVEAAAGAQRRVRRGAGPPGQPVLVPASGPRTVAQRAADSLAEEEAAAAALAATEVGEVGLEGEIPGANAEAPLPWARLVAGVLAVGVTLGCVWLMTRRPAAEEGGVASGIDRSQVRRLDELASPQRELDFGTGAAPDRENRGEALVEGGSGDGARSAATAGSPPGGAGAAGAERRESASASASMSVRAMEVARAFAQAADGATRAELCRPVPAGWEGVQADFLADEAGLPRGFAKIVGNPLALAGADRAWQVTVEDRGFRQWPLELVDGEDGVKVDALASFGLGMVPWTELAQAAGGEPLELRVTAAPETYFNFRFASSSRWHCLGLTNPQDSRRWFGYVAGGSEAQRQLRVLAPALLGAPGQPGPQRLRVKVKFSAEDAARAQLEIVEVLAANWSATGDPGQSAAAGATGGSGVLPELELR